MKKPILKSSLLVSLSALAACASVEPTEPMAYVDEAERKQCKKKAPIGSHVKEEDCSDESSDPRVDHDIENIFGDIVFESVEQIKEVPEGTCGGG